MVAMLNSARRLKKKLKDRVKKTRQRQAKRYAVALRSGEIAMRQATRAAGLWQPEVVEDLVVSLTSFPVRIGKLHRVIRGLLAQSLQPRKIVLYVSLEEFPDRALPKELMALTSDRFEIRFVEGNLRPYKKLLYALTDFPQATIVTVDDDNLYPSDCLARLWQASVANPRTVICVRGRCMQIQDGEISHYMDWAVTRSSKPSFMIFPVGGWGILYPPGSLNPMIDRQELFTELAPLNDDVWFKAMSLLQDVPCYAIGSTKPSARLKYENDFKLWDVNQRGDRYQETVVTVFDRVGLSVDAILAKEAALEARQVAQGAKKQPRGGVVAKVE
jgi:hypothetical protein